jgi:hypothetical protein
MAVGEIGLLQKTTIATATATQYRGMQVSGAAVTAGGAGYPAATGGVIGDAIPLTLVGVAIGEAGAAVAFGAALEFDASGRYITRTTGITVARALTAASAAGAQMEILVITN